MGRVNTSQSSRGRSSSAVSRPTTGSRGAGASGPTTQRGRGNPAPWSRNSGQASGSTRNNNGFQRSSSFSDSGFSSGFCFFLYMSKCCYIGCSPDLYLNFVIAFGWVQMFPSDSQILFCYRYQFYAFQLFRFQVSCPVLKRWVFFVMNNAICCEAMFCPVLFCHLS